MSTLATVGHSATLFEQGEAKLVALCRALAMEHRKAEVVGLFGDLLGPHGATSVDDAAIWPSDICDDHGPFEFSVSMSPRRADLRILAETLGAHPTLASLQEAGATATSRLAARLGLPLDRLRRVEDLFHSEEPEGSFSRWHAVEFSGNEAPSLKVYLNPLIRGPSNSASLLEEALRRLGLPHAWEDVARRATRGEKDEFKYFSLDLAHGPAARVKVYVRQHGIDASDLENALVGCRGYTPGDATKFCRKILGSDGPFDSNPIISCFSWVTDDLRPSATIHIPIRGYVRHDGDAFARISGFMMDSGIPTTRYEKLLRAFVCRPLEEGCGAQSYVSAKIDGDATKVSVYLGPETYNIRPPMHK